MSSAARLVVALWALALVVAGCGSDAAEPPVEVGEEITSSPDAPADPVVGGTRPTIAGDWVLDSAVVDGEPVALLDDHPVTMTIDRGEVTGISACNTYSATANGDDGEFVLGDIALTRMACEDPVMAVENAYITALERVTSAEADPDGLTLAGDGVTLRFVPA